MIAQDPVLRLRNPVQSAFVAFCSAVMALAFLSVAVVDGVVLIGLPGALIFGYTFVRAIRACVEIDGEVIRDRGSWRTRRYDRDQVSAVRVSRAHALPWFGVELDIEPSGQTVKLTGASFWGERGRRKVSAALSRVF